MTTECQPVLAVLQSRLDELQESLKNKVTLPDVRERFSREVYQNMLEAFIQSVASWDKTEQPLQAVYMEHGGAGTSPYDPYGLFYGFADCNDSFVCKHGLFDENGGIDMSSIYDGVEEMREAHDAQYSEIREYFNLFAAYALNIVFGNVVKRGHLDALNVKKPFYFLSAEHDEDRILVFKLP